MKLVVILAHFLRILANSMRAVENKLYYAGCNLRARLERASDRMSAKADQLREHAGFVDGAYRDSKIKQAVAEVDKEVDRRVLEVYTRANAHSAVASKIANILDNCK